MYDGSAGPATESVGNPRLSRAVTVSSFEVYNSRMADRFEAPRSSERGEAARSGAARSVWVLANDLMLGSRIRSVLEAMNVATTFLGGARDLTAPDAEAAPGALIVDLDAAALSPIEAIRAAKVRAVPVLAYGSHVDEARMDEARSAGADLVVPRSAVASRLGDLVSGLLDGTSAA